MLSIRAKTYFRTPQEGGLTSPPFPGIQPSFNVGGQLIVCRVYPETGQELPAGHRLSTRIELPYGERYRTLIAEGSIHDLHVGERVVGQTEVIDIVDDA
jgi:hypothetical protein